MHKNKRDSNSEEILFFSHSLAIKTRREKTIENSKLLNNFFCWHFSWKFMFSIPYICTNTLIFSFHMQILLFMYKIFNSYYVKNSHIILEHSTIIIFFWIIIYMPFLLFQKETSLFLCFILVHVWTALLSIIFFLCCTLAFFILLVLLLFYTSLLVFYIFSKTFCEILKYTYTSYECLGSFQMKNKVSQGMEDFKIFLKKN